MRLRHRLPPQSRLMQSIPSWVNPEAVWASNFELGRYWRSGAGILPATSVLATTRASGINLPNMAGVYQTLGINTLPRTDRGLYANGQIAALNVNGNNPQSETGWLSTNISISDGGAHRGIFNSAIVKATASANSACRRTAALTISAGQTVGIKDAFSSDCPDASGEAVFRVIDVTNSVNYYWRGPLGAMTPDASYPMQLVHQDAENFRVLFTPENAGLYSFGIGPNVLDKQIRSDGIDITTTPFIPDAWVSTSSPPPTLLASDIRAVQGVRPDTNPEPVPGWEAAGLDDGVTILLDFENRMRQGSARQVVTLTDASNAVVAILDTSSAGTSFRLTAGGDSDAFPGAQTGGRSRAACRVMPDGAFALAQEGQGSVTTGTKPSPINLASTARLTIGNRPSLVAPWDDWIYSLQICKPLSDAELLEWVNA